MYWVLRATITGLLVNNGQTVGRNNSSRLVTVTEVCGNTQGIFALISNASSST